MKTTDLKPVHPEIIKKTEQELGYTIPEKFTLDGKDFRKYLAKKFEKQKKKLHTAQAMGFITRLSIEIKDKPKKKIIF